MKKTTFTALIVALSFITLGYAQPLQAAKLSGTLSLSGAWAIYPLAVKWAEAFHKLHPNVRFDISAGGAGKGMADALSGAVDIGMVSREVDKAEKAKGAYAVFIAKDGVFPVVSDKNPAIKQILANGISRKSFVAIYINAKPFTWRQIAGGPSAPVHAYTRSDACGAASAWAAMLGSKYKQDDLKGIGVYGDPGLLEAVRRDKLGIVYSNLSYLFWGKLTRGVKIVPIDANRNGKTDPEERIDTRDKACKAISSGRYPGARREFFVTKGRPKGLAAEFIKFALSDAGTKILEEVGGYVPLSKSERSEVTSKIR